MATYTITIDGLAGIDSTSVQALADEGFTVSGGVATREVLPSDAPFMLPDELSRGDGSEFYGYYIEDPGDADTQIDIYPDRLTGDVTYHTSFLFFYSVRFYLNGSELIDLRYRYSNQQTTIIVQSAPSPYTYWRLRSNSMILSEGVVALADIGFNDPSEYTDLAFDVVTEPVYTVTLANIGGIAADAVEALKAEWFTISGNTATIRRTESDSLYIPTIWKDGYRFDEWSPYGDIEVELEAGDITSDMIFTAVFSQGQTLTLSGLANIDTASRNKLIQIGYTVNGDTATYTYYDSSFPFYLPSVSEDGHILLGWYETSGTPADTKSRVLFTPASATVNAYTANFISSELTVAREIAKLRANLEAAYGMIAAKGGTVPANKTAYNLFTAIESIPSNT